MVSIIKMHIQTTVQYYYTPTRMSTVKNEASIKYWQKPGATKLSFASWSIIGTTTLTLSIKTMI